MSLFQGERRMPRAAVLAGLCLTALALAGCGSFGLPKAPSSGLIPHLGSKAPPPSAPTAGIGVNTYLWRATLDTLAFMPLASADPFGGVVITDWYAPPETPGERFKTTVYILDKVLRADGVRVALFRQVRDGAGTWNDAPVDAKTVTDLENAVLTRARQLRMASAER